MRRHLIGWHGKSNVYFIYVINHKFADACNRLLTALFENAARPLFNATKYISRGIHVCG